MVKWAQQQSCGLPARPSPGYAKPWPWETVLSVSISSPEHKALLPSRSHDWIPLGTWPQQQHSVGWMASWAAENAPESSLSTLWLREKTSKRPTQKKTPVASVYLPFRRWEFLMLNMRQDKLLKYRRATKIENKCIFSFVRCVLTSVKKFVAIWKPLPCPLLWSEPESREAEKPPGISNVKLQRKLSTWSRGIILCIWDMTVSPFSQVKWRICLQQAQRETTTAPLPVSPPTVGFGTADISRRNTPLKLENNPPCSFSYDKSERNCKIWGSNVAVVSGSGIVKLGYFLCEFLSVF